jgi:hypothetical protein
VRPWLLFLLDGAGGLELVLFIELNCCVVLLLPLDVAGRLFALELLGVMLLADVVVLLDMGSRLELLGLALLVGVVVLLYMGRRLVLLGFMLLAGDAVVVLDENKEVFGISVAGLGSTVPLIWSITSRSVRNLSMPSHIFTTLAGLDKLGMSNLICIMSCIIFSIVFPSVYLFNKSYSLLLAVAVPVWP